MPKTAYTTGDTIVLKSRIHGDHASQQSATVVAVLPETRGSSRLRVRFDGENFDRTVSRDDIDPLASTVRAPVVAARPPVKSGGWINHDLVRTKK